jgi:hypothetical protein
MPETRTMEQYGSDLDAHLNVLREGAPKGLRFTAELYSLLGCDHFSYTTTGGGGELSSIFEMQKPHVPPRYRTVIVPALANILELVARSEDFLQANNAITLMGALAHHKCLADCMATPDSAYGVARCLLSSGKSSGNMTLHRRLSPRVLAMVGRSAKLTNSHNTMLDKKMLCTLLFGEMWWDLRRPDEVEGRSVADVVRLERPPFMNGLVPWSNAEPLALPVDMGTAC